MILDSRLEFADSQTLTASGAATNSIDLTVDGDIGPGTPMYAVIQVEAIESNGADETYVAALQTDGDTAFGSTSEVATVTIPRSAAVGSRFVMVVPPIVDSNERYLRLYLTLGGVSKSITFSSWLTDQQPVAWQAYDSPAQA